MLTSGMTAARHTVMATMAAIREIEGLRGTDPGYPAVPNAASPMRHRHPRTPWYRDGF